MHWVRQRLIVAVLTLGALLSAGCDRFDWASIAATLDAPASAGLTQVTLTETVMFGSGVTGITYLTITVDVPAATYQIERQSADPVEGALPASDLAALVALVEKADFSNLRSFYLSSDENCCGVVHSEITVVRAGETFRVTGDESAPEAFHDIVRFMEALDARASTGLTRVTLTETPMFGSGDTGVAYLTVTVDVPAGRLRVERRNADPVESTLPASDVAALTALVEEADFFHLRSVYLSSDKNCCGVVHYTVTVERAGEAFSVTSDGAAPEGYHDIVRFLEAISMAAPTGLAKLTLTESVALGGSGGEVYLTVMVDAAAGTFRVERRDADPVEGAISAEDVATLEALLEEVGFFDLTDESTVSDKYCCGIGFYTVTIERGGQTSAVTVSEDKMPEGYSQVLRFIEALAAP